jgi:hypothetical protein
VRFLLIATISCAVIGLALACGLLRPGLTLATLQRHAERSVLECMHESGFGSDHALVSSPAEEQTQSRHHRALERCWSHAANDDRFERLALTDPIALRKQLREDGFKAWRCAERAGYTRTTPIPLSGSGGYPLQLAAGNFRVGPSERDLERFYRVAATCSGDPLTAFRWSDGTFSRDPADGVSRCTHHEHHGSGLHAHGCYGAAGYPDRTGNAER